MKIKTELLDSINDTKIADSIHQKVLLLNHFFSHIKKANIVFKSEKNTCQDACVAEVTLHIPNAIIFIKERSICCEKALDKALIGLKLQLLRYKAKRLSLGLM